MKPLQILLLSLFISSTLWGQDGYTLQLSGGVNYGGYRNSHESVSGQMGSQFNMGIGYAQKRIRMNVLLEINHFVTVWNVEGFTESEPEGTGYFFDVTNHSQRWNGYVGLSVLLTKMNGSGLRVFADLGVSTSLDKSGWKYYNVVAKEDEKYLDRLEGVQGANASNYHYMGMSFEYPLSNRFLLFTNPKFGLTGKRDFLKQKHFAFFNNIGMRFKLE